MQKNQQHIHKFHSNIPFAFNSINPTNLTVSNFGSDKNSKSEMQIPNCTYSILITINTYYHKQQLRKHTKIQKVKCKYPTVHTVY